MKKKVIIASLFLMSSLSFAQVNDPVKDQIRQTQDAVRLAQEEVENGLGDSPNSSADSDVKMTTFNNDAAQALREFEAAVRLKILGRVQGMISQYNQIARNSEMAEARQSLMAQLTFVSAELGNAYIDELSKLYRPLGTFPVMVEGYDSDISPFTNNGESFFNFKDFSGAVKVIEASSSSYDDLKQENGKIVASDGLTKIMDENNKYLAEQIMKGCYSVICFYSSLYSAQKWASVVENILTRKLVLRLVDGNVITISPIGRAVNGRYKAFIGSMALGFVKPTDRVNSLPNSVVASELGALESAEVQRVARETAQTNERNRIEGIRSRAMAIFISGLNIVYEHDGGSRCAERAKEAKKLLRTIGRSLTKRDYLDGKYTNRVFSLDDKAVRTCLSALD